MRNIATLNAIAITMVSTRVAGRLSYVVGVSSSSQSSSSRLNSSICANVALIAIAKRRRIGFHFLDLVWCAIFRRVSKTRTQCEACMCEGWPVSLRRSSINELFHASSWRQCPSPYLVGVLLRRILVNRRQSQGQVVFDPCNKDPSVVGKAVSKFGTNQSQAAWNLTAARYHILGVLNTASRSLKQFVHSHQSHHPRTCLCGPLSLLEAFYENIVHLHASSWSCTPKARSRW